MSRARYTGAHVAKEADAAPAEKAPIRKKPKRAKPPVLRPALPTKRKETDRAKQSPPSGQKRTSRIPASEETRLVSMDPTAREQPGTQEGAGPSRTASARVQVSFMPPIRRRPSRRLIFLLAAISAALLLAVVAILLRKPLDEGAYEKNMAKAIEACDRADLDNALRYLRRAASYEETDECLRLMASCYEQAGMLDKALELLREIETPDTWTVERIQRIEQQRARQMSADTVEVLGALLPPDTTELSLDDRGLGDADLQEIVKLYALDKLSLAGNRIRDISPLAQLGGLNSLDLSGNAVSDLSPLSGMTDLRELSLDRNPLNELSPLYALEELNTLSIRGCGVGEEQLAALAAALPACAILSDTAGEDALVISLGGQTFRSDVEELDLSACGVRDISVLAFCKELRRLDLKENEINNLQGLMNLPQLNWLDISANQIGDLRPLMGVETLRRLKAARNLLTDTSALSTMSGLQTLDLSGNPIADFSGLRWLVNLSSLDVSDTGLKDEDLYYLSGLSMLKKLRLDDNPDLGNDAFGMLKSSLPDCSISHTELVYSISIDGQSVSSNVTELDLSGCGISDLSGLERLNHLEKLDLSRNRISNLYVLQISASRSGLTELNLAFNQIGSVSDLVALAALERLNLYGNPLESMQPLKSMTGLQWLNVGSCGLTEDALFELRTALPGCEIVLDA